MNINKALDKAFEKKPLKELVDIPVSALQGVSDNDAKLLYEAFKVKTIRDLAKLKSGLCSNGTKCWNIHPNIYS